MKSCYEKKVTNSDLELEHYLYPEEK